MKATTTHNLNKDWKKQKISEAIFAASTCHASKQCRGRQRRPQSLTELAFYRKHLRQVSDRQAAQLMKNKASMSTGKTWKSILKTITE